MVLNYIWVAFFGIAFLIAAGKLVFAGDAGVFPAIMDSTFRLQPNGVRDLPGPDGRALALAGHHEDWRKRRRYPAFSPVCLSPLFSKLFPEIPQGHPVTGNIFMNLAANMLGLDNAATPFGLKAMEGLQELNPRKDTASNPMIVFLVLNAAGLTLIPVSIMVYRAQMGAAQAYGCVCFRFCWQLFFHAGGYHCGQPLSAHQPAEPECSAASGRGLSACFSRHRVLLHAVGPGTSINLCSTTFANVLLFCIIIAFIAAGVRKRVNVYDAFIEGAKDGFTTAVRIIPYSVAILVGIGVFRASGAMDFLLTDGIAAVVKACGGDADFVGALPTALMKPLSGSGARGMMVDALETYGADSFVGRLSCIFQGATDTTFYILAVYFGSVGITRTRHAVACGLLADLAGIVAAIGVAYLFFGA